jgi:hypothetical protein
MLNDVLTTADEEKMLELIRAESLVLSLRVQVMNQERRERIEQEAK